MKHSKLILTLASLALVSMGCAKEFKSSDNVAATPAPLAEVVPTYPTEAPPGQGAGSAGDNWAYGASVAFTPDSLDMMNNYVGIGVGSHPLNNPTNIKLNVNVYDVGAGKFGGQVKIAYDDNGQHYEGYFIAGTGVNKDFESYGTANNVGAFEANYNTWLNPSTFSGYFQDTLGAIVLVVDEAGPNLGDGQGSTTVNGSVWFKNFANAFPQQGSQRFCWFITRGPYQCHSPIMNSKSSPYPSDTYRRLGTFKGLTKAKAFNQ
ncbi:MAG: hypothetical protein EOP09_20435 [Proteobacteria bacterium]|nr:MAG: hypothetical protein EOP09_20435 [Pseudomonadota bacterium]